MFASRGKWVCFVLHFFFNCFRKWKSSERRCTFTLKGRTPLWFLLFERPFTAFLPFILHSQRLGTSAASMIFRKAEQLLRNVYFMLNRKMIDLTQTRGELPIFVIFTCRKDKVSIAECLYHNLAIKRSHLLSFVTLCRAACSPVSITLSSCTSLYKHRH